MSIKDFVQALFPPTFRKALFINISCVKIKEEKQLPQYLNFSVKLRLKFVVIWLNVTAGC